MIPRLETGSRQDRHGGPNFPAENRKILVLGQAPPPFHGQALMIHKLVTAGFQRIQLFHVRMTFSLSVQSVGRVRAGKVIQLLQVASRVLRLRFRHGAMVLYYAPAGPKLVPIVRDLVLLSLLRPFFAKTIYHFHAAGLSDYLKAKPRWVRSLAHAAYGRPDGAIQTSALNPADAEFLGARRLAVIPNGLEDDALPFLTAERSPEPRTRILFVGIVGEGKGAMVLLEAARLLAESRDDFSVWFMGQFTSGAFERRAHDYCREYNLTETVSFLGQQLGNDKWKYFHRADILCFPSFFESESFGNVAVEGMMFGLPVVATCWRGIPDLVEHGGTGLLVPIRDAEALASALATLLQDEKLRHTLGSNGRRKYLEHYTIERHLQRMEEFLFEVASE